MSWRQPYVVAPKRSRPSTEGLPCEAARDARRGSGPPGDLVLDLMDVDLGAVLAVVRRQVAALNHPPMTVDEVLVRLEEQGLARSVARLRELSGVEE